MGTHVFDKFLPGRPKPDGTLPEAQSALPDPKNSHPTGPRGPSAPVPEGHVLAHQHPVATGEEKVKHRHYNRITKEWEEPGKYEVSARQDGSTMPEEIGEPLPEKPSFKQQVAGNAKKFAGKTFGHEHEVAQGEALLAGESPNDARVAAEHVKQQHSH